EFTTSQENTWQSNNSLDIVCNKVKIGSFGQLSDDTAEITQLEASAMIFDLDFDKIQEQCREEKEYKKVSLHPSAHRDISGIINDTITNAEILEVIEKIEKSDLINVEGSILDVYKKGLPNNKKSITLKIILEHSEKTLNTEEIDTIVRKIINGLSDKFGWEERK
ncbi:hypothetical protein M0Q03_01495, partial [bacterium]|nr:hypothetical protein [bacterium]